MHIYTRECRWRSYKSIAGLYLSLGYVLYLVLLLEAVALGALHLGDVLEEVCHADRRVQLTRLVRHIRRLPLPQRVGVRLHQAAGVAAHVLALIWGTQQQVRAGQDTEVGASNAD